MASYEYLQFREMSRSQRYRLGRPPMVLEESAKSDQMFEGEQRHIERPIIGSSGLSGVVPEGNYQPTPSGGL